jgi:transcriptional regulator with XRE-family HTH domain
MQQLLKCPSCGTRLVPRPEEIKDLRHFAELTQREMARYLGVKSSHVAYLENGRRFPSGDLILRYRKVERMLLSKSKSRRKLAS